MLRTLVHRRQARSAMATVAGTLCLALGCAQIHSETSIRVVAKRDAPRTLDPAGPRIAALGFDVQWQQRLDEMSLKIDTVRSCELVWREPAVRIEHVQRKADAALYWEWGLGSVLTGIGVMGFAAPKTLANTSIDELGEVTYDNGTAYRIAGVFGSIGLLLLGGAIYDTVRSRDEIRYVDVTRTVAGGPVACVQPIVPARRTAVELRVGAWRDIAETDEEGRVTLLLPAQSGLALPIAAPVQRATHPVLVRIGDEHTITLDVQVVYANTLAEPWQGRVSVERRPTRPKQNAATAPRTFAR